MSELSVQWPDASAPVAFDDNGPPTKTLADRFARAGRPLNTRCGQRGQCRGCTVELVRGQFRQTDGETLSGPATIKACSGQLAADTDAVIVVPARAVAIHRAQVVSTFTVKVAAAQAPMFPIVPGSSDHALAIDIGTTTVVVTLVELATGRIVAENAALNRQVELGDDVVTRIQLAENPSKRAALHEAITAHTLDPLIGTVAAWSGIARPRIAGAVIAGNTTMLHLLAGVDPSPMGRAPFVPAFLEHRVQSAREIGLTSLPPETPIHLLPGFSAFVGSDLVAGSCCTGLADAEDPTLLVDIGTNGEIVLSHDGRLFATATAAGPAFEGGRLASGSRAVAGAITHLAWTAGQHSPVLETIPGGRATIGLCGSAYVDLLAVGRKAGLLSPNGRFVDPFWESLPTGYRYHNVTDRGVLLREHDRATLVTEADIAQLLQAKAAIAAGILAVLHHAGLAPVDVRRMYLAGGFGLHLDLGSAIACGLLPGFAAEQIEVVGNTALGGAWLALVDDSVIPEMSRLARSAETVELNLEPGFEDLFIDQLTLP